MKEQSIRSSWLVSVQSGKDYKEMSDLIKVSYESGIELFKNYNGVIDRVDHNSTAKIDEKINFRENPYIYMFYAPRKDEEELHVPDCDDYVVFYVKKSKALKAYRIF